MYSVYGSVAEDLPKNAPVPLGKTVVMSTYKDVNLYHDWTTGRAVTGILHFLNGTPVDWYSKRQNTVETATYCSEFVAAWIATNQIIDLRMTLRYLGVPVVEKSCLFGDNQSVVTSSTIPHSSLNKRHNALLPAILFTLCRILIQLRPSRHWLTITEKDCKTWRKCSNKSPHTPSQLRGCVSPTTNIIYPPLQDFRGCH